MSRLLSEPAWQALVEATDWPHIDEALKTLTRAVTPADVQAFLEIARGQPSRERTAAMRVVARLHWDAAPVLDSNLMAQWVEFSREVASAGFPEAPDSSMAFHTLIRAAPDQADRVLAALRVETLSAEARPLVLALLISLRSPTSTKALQELSRLPVPEAEEAKGVLERRGVVSPEAMEKAIADWRRRRTAARLSRLYNVYVRNLAEGSPLADLQAVLGKPTRSAGFNLFYEVGNACLLILTDASERVLAWKLN